MRLRIGLAVRLLTKLDLINRSRAGPLLFHANKIIAPPTRLVKDWFVSR